MAIYRTSELGWSAGQDVSEKFAALVEDTLREGDTLVLEHMYEISSLGHVLPDDFTLTAEFGGGFDIVETAGKSNMTFLHPGNGNTIDNVAFLHSDTPRTGYSGHSPQMGEDFHNVRTITVTEKSDVSILNSRFEGYPVMFVAVDGGARLNVENTVFDGAHYQMRWHKSTTDFTVRESVFQNALGDGIKTMKSGGFGAERHKIIDSVFLDNNRDGIDTTGGFQDSLVSGTIFQGNGVSGIDIKSVIHDEEDVSPRIRNDDIEIVASEFVDNRSAVVITALDRVGGILTAQTADELMPNNIFLRDVTVVNSQERMADGGEVRAIFLKDGHTIQWSDMRLVGDVDELRLLNAEAPDGWSAHDIGGTVTRHAAQPRPSDHPVKAGPVDEAPAAVDDEIVSPEEEIAAPSPEESDPETPQADDAGTPPRGEVDWTVNAGGDALSSDTGLVFAGDEGFSGGRIYVAPTNMPIEGTGEDALYRSERYGDFGFSRPAADGAYEVTLKFAEVYHEDVGDRVFDVRAEGALVLDDFDIVKAAGGRGNAIDIVVPLVVSDGGIDLDFITETDNAKISGIEIRYLGAEADAPAEEPVRQRDPAPYDLVWSDNSARSGARDLEGAVLAGDAFVFVTGTEDAARVNFYLDDPLASGAPVHVEREFNHDFAGGGSEHANAWDTSTIDDGAHTITAEIIGVDGNATLVLDSFYVLNF